jgi:hypothetical protein
MKKLTILLLFIISCSQANRYDGFDFTTSFEQSDGLETATYPEVIQYYRALAATFPEITLDSLGLTDSGEPLHFVTYNPASSGSVFTELREENAILLVNNGIHPGESDGIDATMMMYRDLAQGTIKAPENVIIVTIPVYNIGGSLNRNTGTRTNQNGPISYGFRGNAQNYDLNRDFIKADSRNAQSFAQIFQMIQPDVFIDNHVSNGADYQYTLTHLFTQHNKLGGPQGEYLHENLRPMLEDHLAQNGWDITPYVNVFNRAPETGFTQFMDYPRYSTGYATLFNTLGLMVETHMLKPYKQRVEGTYQIMISMIEIMDRERDKIKALKKEQINYWLRSPHYPIKWAVDTSRTTTLDFKGFEGSYVESELTGGRRLKYDHTKPFTKAVKYFNYFNAIDSIQVPDAYIVPKGWHHVIARLEENSIEMWPLSQDSLMLVQQYRIQDFETRRSPYEGHYPHFNTFVSSKELEVLFRKGDYYIPTSQNGIRYLLETLEPGAYDSFFNWNYFDTILQQKEGFSPYVWEDKAAEILKANPELQKEFERKRKTEQDFRDNWYAQLSWLHKQSDYYEKAHMNYPIYRVFNSVR